MSGALADSLPDPLLRTHWGDLDYPNPPDQGQFAVLFLHAREKRFYRQNLASPLELHAAIERHFGARAERVAEFVWAV